MHFHTELSPEVLQLMAIPVQCAKHGNSSYMHMMSRRDHPHIKQSLNTENNPSIKLYYYLNECPYIEQAQHCSIEKMYSVTMRNL